MMRRAAMRVCLVCVYVCLYVFVVYVSYGRVLYVCMHVCACAVCVHMCVSAMSCVLRPCVLVRICSDDADDAPLGGLQMEFIYGARMTDSRNCAQVGA